MAKKIIIIHGSSRKKNTYAVAQGVEQILRRRGMDTEILPLFDYEIKDCAGCEHCVHQDGCSMTDDMRTVMEKIRESDGMVFASPVYMNGATSKFKTFADRTNAWVHKPELAGKPVLFVATTASTGRKDIQGFFEKYATGLGARKGELVFRSGKKMNQPVQEQEMKRFLALLEEEPPAYRPAMNEIVMFTVQKVMALQSEGSDRAYWEEKGWFDKPYYYPCAMNPAKKAFGKMMRSILSKAMR